MTKIHFLLLLAGPHFLNFRENVILRGFQWIYRAETAFVDSPSQRRIAQVVADKPIAMFCMTILENFIAVLTAYVIYNYIFYSNYSPRLSDRIDGVIQTLRRIRDELLDSKLISGL